MFKHFEHSMILHLPGTHRYMTSLYPKTMVVSGLIKQTKKHQRFQTTRYVSNIKSPFCTLHPLNLPAVETLETKLRNSRTEATRLEDLESFKARLQYVQVQLDQSKSKLPTFEVVVVFFLDQKEIRKLLCFVFFFSPPVR